METIQMSINSKMDKYIVVYSSYNDIVRCHESK